MKACPDTVSVPLSSPRSCRTHLQVLPILQLCFILLLLVFRPLRLSSVELTEVALVVVKALGVLVHDISCNGVEESSVV